MGINIFEGARRIALLIGGLWAAGCVAFAVFAEPSYSANYVILWPGVPPRAVTKGCSYSDATRYLDSTTPDGTNLKVKLCFAAHKADDGRELVPYEIGEVSRPVMDYAALAKQYGGTTQSAAPDYAALAARFGGKPISDAEQIPGSSPGPASTSAPGPNTSRRSMMNDQYSPAVSKYADGVRDGFRLPTEGLGEALALKRRAYIEQWTNAGKFLFGGLAVWWAVVAGAGWIVRGFMGIPRGADRRPAS